MTGKLKTACHFDCSKAKQRNLTKYKPMDTNNATPNTINRKEAIQKIGNYGKYAALTALGTYFILNPQKAQASSPPIDGGGEGF